MIITRAESRHSLVIFTYFNSMICIFKVEFNKIRDVHKAI